MMTSRSSTSDDAMSNEATRAAGRFCLQIVTNIYNIWLARTISCYIKKY